MDYIVLVFCKIYSYAYWESAKNCLTVSIGGMVLKQVKSIQYRYLGLIIDSTLSFSLHIIVLFPKLD